MKPKDWRVHKNSATGPRILVGLDKRLRCAILSQVEPILTPESEDHTNERREAPAETIKHEFVVLFMGKNRPKEMRRMLSLGRLANRQVAFSPKSGNQGLREVLSLTGGKEEREDTPLYNRDLPGRGPVIATQSIQSDKSKRDFKQEPKHCQSACWWAGRVPACIFFALQLAINISKVE